MPTWTRLELAYEACEGATSQPFAGSRAGFSAATLARASHPIDSGRQSHFERQLERVSAAIGSDEIPVFLDFAGRRCRMDKGCVGHAVARGFLEMPADGPQRIVTTVTIRRSSPGGRA